MDHRVYEAGQRNMKSSVGVKNGDQDKGGSMETDSH